MLSTLENLLLFYCRYASDYERIIAAAADFSSGRVWPVNFASESGPKFVWEKVKIIELFLDHTYDELGYLISSSNVTWAFKKAPLFLPLSKPKQLKKRLISMTMIWMRMRMVMVRMLDRESYRTQSQV